MLENEKFQLTSEQVQIVLESLTEEKINCYINQRKRLIELEVHKSISKEEYEAFSKFIDNRVDLIESTHKSILEQLHFN